MRWRVILGLSLVANLVLAIGWRRATQATHSMLVPPPAVTNTVIATNARPAVIVRRQFFSWQELESRDYPTYIKNLRAIGCPEQTIRDIIIADVTQMLREKHQEQSPRLKPNPKWWTNIRDQAAEDAESKAANTMWAERGAILEQLLGPDWAVRERSVPPQTNRYHSLILATMELNPTLQGLSAEKKQAVAALLSRSPEEAGSSQTIGRYDPADAMASEKANWTKLAEMLALDQLEAAKLHFSSHAENLRSELDSLPSFDTQPEEFRKIFRTTEAIDEQLFGLGERDDAEAQQRREKLLAERDAAVRAILTPARFEQYARLRDPAYLSALEKLMEGNGNPATLGTLYAINRETTAEQERIQNDETLTETQREIELKRIELEQLKATAQALGEKLLDDAEQKAPPKPEPKKVHSVAAGEGLDRIARIYGVDPGALRAANPNVNFDKLQPGVNVNVPLRLIYPLPPPD